MYIAYCWNLQHLLNNSNLRWTLTSKVCAGANKDRPDVIFGAVNLQVQKHQRTVVHASHLQVWRRLQWRRKRLQCRCSLPNDGHGHHGQQRSHWPWAKKTLCGRNQYVHIYPWRFFKRNVHVQSHLHIYPWRFLKGMYMYITLKMTIYCKAWDGTDLHCTVSWHVGIEKAPLQIWIARHMQKYVNTNTCLQSVHQWFWYMWVVGGGWWYVI